MTYDSLESFMADIPMHAARHQDELRGHDMTAVLETKQGRRLAVRLRDGQVEFPEGEVKADCSVTADEQVLLDMINGKLSPVKALLLRKIVLHGDVTKLLALIRLAG